MTQARVMICQQCGVTVALLPHTRWSRPVCSRCWRLTVDRVSKAFAESYGALSLSTARIAIRAMPSDVVLGVGAVEHIAAWMRAADDDTLAGLRNIGKGRQSEIRRAFPPMEQAVGYPSWVGEGVYA